MTRGLLHTSVVVARGDGKHTELPDLGAVSALTLADLHMGALVAHDHRRARRLATLAQVEREYRPLPIDESVARRFGALVAAARREGRRPRTADALIAATAIAHDLPLYTRDHHFTGLPELQVLLV